MQPGQPRVGHTAFVPGADGYGTHGEDHGRQFIDSVGQFEGEYRVLATLSDNDDVSQVGNSTESNGCEPFTGICTNRGGYDNSRHSKRQGNHLDDLDSIFEAEDDLNDSRQCTQRRHRRHQRGRPHLSQIFITVSCRAGFCSENENCSIHFDPRNHA